MKIIVALFCALMSSAAFAGNLECETRGNGLPYIHVSLYDSQDTLTITKSGVTRDYALTRQSSAQSRYQLPFVVFSDSFETVQFAVFKNRGESQLRGHVTFAYADPSAPTYEMVCSYLVSE